MGNILYEVHIIGLWLAYLALKGDEQFCCYNLQHKTSNGIFERFRGESSYVPAIFKPEGEVFVLGFGAHRDEPNSWFWNPLGPPVNFLTCFQTWASNKNLI